VKTIVVDTGPLVALVNPKDTHHSWAKQTFSIPGAHFLTCEAVLAESFHLLDPVANGRSTLIQLCQLQFFQTAFRFEQEQTEILRLLKKYEDIRMDFADACLVRISDTVPDSVVWTIDSDFKIYRRSDRRVIPVLAPWS
jgi:predicted nucleic acid-binding protein